MNDKNSFENIVKWAIIIILGVVALRIALGVLAIGIGLAGFLLFNVLPLVLVVWLAIKGVQWLRASNGSTPPPPPSTF